jgi:hypothetical protein
MNTLAYLVFEVSNDILTPPTAILDKREPNALAYFVFVINECSSIWFSLSTNALAYFVFDYKNGNY